MPEGSELVKGIRIKKILKFVPSEKLYGVTPSNNILYTYNVYPIATNELAMD